ncbi:DUF6612 family protein [Jeotgalibacillus haloalkalitolerans]|uniref:DUF6612 family protein n=1 Tax=Jeotgalibacillus haloalkalitolerans TaxID=3104292 RepID=A0ABU5KMR7_9BACL|nr:DUF6612 family protein [Jeotgalibacillus sp. HH7-29]MDZ5712552.1 DUF6612 family protein [Jeotgalibacillus sp. HH7-29]
MKKSILFTTAALTLALTACSETAEPADGSKDASSMTLEEVYSKAIEENNEIESVKSSAVLNQNVTMGEEGSINTVSEIDMSIKNDPLTVHQVNTTKMTGEGTDGESFTVESYMNDEGFFMQDPTTNEWMKLPSEMSDQLMQMNESQSNPGTELENLEAYIEDFSFEQNDDSFILTLNASGEKFSDMLIEQTGELMPDLGLGIPTEALFQDTTFEDVLYVITLDKETFLIESLDLDMTMNMKFAEQSMIMEQKLESVYTDYNAVDEVTVPQEVIESAVEIEL